MADSKRAVRYSSCSGAWHSGSTPRSRRTVKTSWCFVRTTSSDANRKGASLVCNAPGTVFRNGLMVKEMHLEWFYLGRVVLISVLACVEDNAQHGRVFRVIISEAIEHAEHQTPNRDVLECDQQTGADHDGRCEHLPLAGKDG